MRTRKSDGWMAPGANQGGYLCPPKNERFRVDDRLAPPETRVEYFHGAELFAAPADPPHATKHADVGYVVKAYVNNNYIMAIDMLTRTGPATDFAPDVSVFPAKPDPETGGRQLEELAFEVTSKQRIRVPTEKARELIRRGVRRVFCVLVKQKQVMEWNRKIDNWTLLPHDYAIEDRCFVQPLMVGTLLDASKGDEAVAKALLAKHVATLTEREEKVRSEAAQKGKTEGKEEGKTEGKIEGKIEGKTEGQIFALLQFLNGRKIKITKAAQKKIEICTDEKLLEKWIRRAARINNIQELFE